MGALDRTDDPLARGLIVGLLVSNTLLQKIAIPGTGGGLPLGLLTTVGLLGLGIALDRLRPVAVVVLAFGATAGVLVTMAGLAPALGVSLNALALVLALLVPYCFALRPGLLDPQMPLRAFVAFAVAFAALGVVQFFAQFVLGPEVAFVLDMALPPDFLLAGFNNLNELSFEAGIYKANGVFLLEASFLNQFLCVAVLIELILARRVWVLGALGAGILVTYSGTGLLMLAAIAPVYVLHRGYLGLAAAGVIGVVLVVTFGEDLGLGTFLDRASEFSSTESSAFARFLSIFHLLDEFVWNDLTAALVGRGPGSIAQNFSRVNYAAFDPSWGKVTYEYGILGCLAYFAFLGFCVLRSQGSGYLKAGLLLQFTFLGGYVSTTPVHIEFWALLTWPTLAQASLAGVAAPPRPRAGRHGKPHADHGWTRA